MIEVKMTGIRRKCLFHDYYNQFAGFAEYWRIDDQLYAFEYENKIYVCTRTEPPEKYKNVECIAPGHTFTAWIKYTYVEKGNKKETVLGIFDKN